MTAVVVIDPNVRLAGNRTYAGVEDVVGDIAVGSEVVVSEPESGLRGSGRITDIDLRRRLVYLEVDWGSLRLASDSPLARSRALSPRTTSNDDFDWVAAEQDAQDIALSIEQAWQRGTWHWTSAFARLVSADITSARRLNTKIPVWANSVFEVKVGGEGKYVHLFPGWSVISPPSIDYRVMRGVATYYKAEAV